MVNLQRKRSMRENNDKMKMSVRWGWDSSYLYFTTNKRQRDAASVEDNVEAHRSFVVQGWILALRKQR